MLQNSTKLPVRLTFTHQFCSQSVTVEKETPLDVDTGFLTVIDLTPVDEDSYKYGQSSLSLNATISKYLYQIKSRGIPTVNRSRRYPSLNSGTLCPAYAAITRRST